MVLRTISASSLAGFGPPGQPRAAAPYVTRARSLPWRFTIRFTRSLPNWLISSRMAEISHSARRNFSLPSEFKRVGTSERKKLKDLKSRQSRSWIATADCRGDEREVHHEIPEIYCTACFIGHAARLFAGCGHCEDGCRSRHWSWSRPRLRGWPSGLRLRILFRLSVCLRALRLLWS